MAFAAVRILIFLGFLFCGVTAIGSTQDNTAVRLQLKWYHQFQFAGFYAAKKLGYFAQARLDVTILEGHPDMTARAAILSGKAEFGVDAGASILRERMNGVPFVALGVIFQNSPLVLLTTSGRGINSPRDLRGRKIMLTPGAAEDAALLAMLRGKDSSVSKALSTVTIVPHSWKLGSLVSGEVDAISAYATNEPFALKESGYEPVVLDPLEYGINFYGDTLFASEDYTHDNMELIERFRIACFHGWEYAMSHPEEIVDHILTLPTKRPWPISREGLLREAQSMQRYIVPKLVQTGQMNPQRWQSMGNILKEFNLAPADGEWERIDYGFHLKQESARQMWAKLAWGLGTILIFVAVAFLWIIQLRNVVRKRTIALTQSEQRNRALLDAIPDMVFVNGQDGTFLDFCGASNAYYSSQDILGKRVHDVIPSQQADSFFNLIQQAITGDAVRNLEYSLTQGESRREFEARAVRCGANEILTLVRDITERKEAEAHRKRLIAALDQAADGIVITNCNREIEYANQAFLLIRQVSREQIQGNLLQIFNLDAGNDENGLWESLANKEVWRGRLRYLLPDGSTCVQDCTIAAVFRESDIIDGYVASIRDVTRQVEMESHLVNTERLEAIGTLAGGIAHDFNNILSIISGYTEMALIEISENSPAYSALKSSLVAIDRAADLVRQILSFSRQIDPERSSIGIRTMVDEAMKFVRATIPTTIQVICRINTDAYVFANATEIHRIVINLVTNAALAMPSEVGTIEVTVDDVEDPLADSTVHNQSVAAWVRLVVKDDGDGIPENILRRVFEPFFSTRKSHGGTGMGLAVVHGIVTSMGGTISVESQKGCGSSFVILLPATREIPMPSAVSSGTKMLAGTEHVLLVDDEAMIIDAIKPFLDEHLGYRVTAFQNSVEGLNFFARSSSQIDIVITDMTMPGLSGLELAEKIREIHSTVPIILCTGYSDLVTEERMRGIGNVHFVLKPIGGRRLAAVVRGILDGDKTDDGLPF